MFMSTGKTPLDLAAHTGHVQQIRLLLGSDSKRSTSILEAPRVQQACEQFPAFDTWLHHELYNPRELKRLCRQTIRTALGPQNTKYINSLPIPRILKDFLLAKHLDLSWLPYLPMNTNSENTIPPTFSFP